jgi:hypothetical protein
MKKIVVAVLAVCVLLSMSPQLTAKVWEIVIKVSTDADGNFFIDMGEKYAYAVPEEATIKWTCLYPFTLKFAEAEAAYFLDTTVVDTPASKIKKVKKDAAKNYAYKYSVTIFKRNSIPEMTLDPVIIIKPPKS